MTVEDSYYHLDGLLLVDESFEAVLGSVQQEEDSCHHIEVGNYQLVEGQLVAKGTGVWLLVVGELT